MKVVLGTNNIANILSGFQAGFQQIGDNAVTVVKERSPYYSDESFKTIYRPENESENNPGAKLLSRVNYFKQRRALNSFLKNSAKDTDIYLFVWSSFRKNWEDLAWLKRKNKKIVVAIAGSEVRFSKAFSQQYDINIDAWDENLRNDNINDKLFYLRQFESYADVILSVPDQMGLAVRPYNHFYLPIDIEKYDFVAKRNEVVKIVHAPTRTGAKGTSNFLEAIEFLRNKGLKFEFTFLQNLKHNDLVKVIGESDILLDELYFHGPGMMAIEAMAKGCLVLTKTLNEEDSVVRPPVVNVSFDSLVSELERAIVDVEWRINRIKEARAYVELHHDAKNVVKKIKQLLESPQPDYYPEFYKRFKS